MGWFTPGAVKLHATLIEEFNMIAVMQASTHFGPSREPYEFLLDVWLTYMRRHRYDKLAMPHIAPLFVKFGAVCEQPAAGVLVMANMVALRIIPGFVESEPGRDFEPTVARFMTSIEQDNGKSLNQLFALLNPKSYEEVVALLDRPPFMSLAEERKNTACWVGPEMVESERKKWGNP